MGWAYIAADLLIFGAYFAIPISIFVFYRRQRTALYFPKLYWLFAAFIFSCGIGHFIDATLFWKPWYRLSMLSNLVTALVSWATVMAMLRYLPEAVRIPGALQLTRELEARITVQKKTEEELRASEARFRTLADHLPLVIFEADASGRVVFLNACFYQITGNARDDDPDALARSCLHPDDLASLSAKWDGRGAELSGFEGECRIRTARGDYLPYMFKTVRMPETENRWVGFGADISRQKEDAEQQVRIERKIQETQKLESLGVLAGGIAHDFNNLLTGMLGSASLAQMDLPPGHPVQEHLKQIETSTVRAADLCRQMLAYSGKGRFVITHVDINSLIEETTYLIQSSISKKAVIRFNLERNLPSCEADVTQLRQVVMNLVINASDAIGDRSGFITLNTGSVRADRDYLARTYGADDLQPGDYVFVEISDTGCGMTPETISRIFDPFFTTKFSGRGLGLAAVLGIIKGHRGAIRVYSEPGKGTTFKILLPATDRRPDTKSAKPTEVDTWRSSGLVLLVDDEETICSVTSRLLEMWGFQCITAPDGKEAVELFRRRHSEIRLVLMDLTMPHLDGEQAYREMRAINPKVQVVLMSGFSEQDAVNRFVGKGLAGFVQKPFYPKQLESVMRRALGEDSNSGKG